MTATVEIDRRGSTGFGEAISKKWIIGLTRAQLQSELEAIGVPERQSRMRASQLWQWLYNRGAQSFDDMTNISKDLRARFAEHFRISRLDIVTEQISSDGTRKWLLRLPPDELGRRHEVDSVHPRRRSGHLVYFQPGRLHTHLHFLPHRHANAGQKPDRRRNCRAGDGCQRPSERVAAPDRQGRERATKRPLHHQHRTDGNG